MHTTNPDGTLIRSLCDFCHGVYADYETDTFADKPMIEGHHGSLICLNCLTVAYTDVDLGGGGAEHSGAKCTMCLEERDQPQWQSPAHPESLICLRCIKQAATALDKDPESGWKRPG